MSARLVFIAIAVSAAALPASAETVTSRVEVRHGDLNLSSDADIARLQGRIDRAVAQVCRTGAPIGDLRAMREEVRCKEQARALATPQVDLAVAGARSGGTLAANDIRITAAR